MEVDGPTPHWCKSGGALDTSWGCIHLQQVGGSPVMSLWAVTQMLPRNPIQMCVLISSCIMN